MRINKRLCRIKRRGRLWYYRTRRKWRRLGKPRFVIRIKHKRRTLKRGRFGKWTLTYKKKRRRLVRRVTRFIRYRGRKMPVRRRRGGGRRRKYSVKNRRGRWTRARKVRRYRRRRKYNFRSSCPRKCVTNACWIDRLTEDIGNKTSVSSTLRRNEERKDVLCWSE